MSITYIKSAISGIAYAYKIRCLTDLTKCFPVQELLRAYTKVKRTSFKRLPITKDILAKLLTFVEKYYTKPYYKHAMYTLYTIMYKLGLRISEIANYNKLYSHAILYKNCKLNKHNLTLDITLETGKHLTKPVDYTIKCSKHLYQHVYQYLRLRGNKNGPLFQHPKGKVFSRRFVVKTLKLDLEAIEIDGQFFNTHSFRSGLATDLALQGCSTEQICLIGRWKSSAFKQYLRPQKIKV